MTRKVGAISSISTSTIQPQSLAIAGAEFIIETKSPRTLLPNWPLNSKAALDMKSQRVLLFISMDINLRKEH